VSYSGRNAGLTRLEDTTRAGRYSQKETWRKCEEERGSYEKIGLGKDETHRASDETVH